jgi:hypothetical protein
MPEQQEDNDLRPPKLVYHTMRSPDWDRVNNRPVWRYTGWWAEEAPSFVE